MDAVRGVEKLLTFKKVQTCVTCSGTRYKPSSKEYACENCGGVGVFI